MSNTVQRYQRHSSGHNYGHFQNHRPGHGETKVFHAKSLEEQGGICGITPNHGWDFGVGVTAIPHVAGTANGLLASGADQTFEEPTAYAGQRASGHPGGDSDHLYRASNDFNYPDEDFMFGTFLRSGAMEATVRGVVGRISTGPTVLWGFSHSPTALNAQFRVDADTRTLVHIPGGDPTWGNRDELILFGVSRTLALGYFMTSEGFRSVSLAAFAPLATSGATLRFNHSGSSFGGDHDLMQSFLWDEKGGDPPPVTQAGIEAVYHRWARYCNAR